MIERNIGYGIAIVTDRNGKEVFSMRVRVEGVGGRNRMVSNSDTPLGVYDIPNKNMWTSGGSRKSYGYNPRLILNGESGEIVKSGRDLIRIHGGRQEVYNEETGKWDKVKNAVLKKTHGCMRAMDGDVKELKATTDNLQKNNSNEFGGKLSVVADLVEKEGKYVLLEAQKDDKKKVDFKLDITPMEKNIDNTYVKHEKGNAPIPEENKK